MENRPAGYVALTPETVANISGVKSTEDGHSEIMKAFHTLSSEKDYLELDRDSDVYGDLKLLNYHIAVDTYKDKVNIYVNHGNSDDPRRPPDLILSRKDLEKLYVAKEYYETETGAMVWGEYPIRDTTQDVCLSREDIEALLIAENLRERTDNHRVPKDLLPHALKYHWYKKHACQTSHNSSVTEKPEKYKFFMMIPCDEGIVAVYEADNMEEPIIPEIHIDTLKKLPEVIMKKRMQKYMIMPKSDSTQPNAGVVEDMFNKRVDFRWNHTDPVTHNMHGLSVVGEGRYMLTYKPENTEMDYAQIQSDTARELAVCESELEKRGISIEGSTGKIRTDGAVLSMSDIGGILEDLKQLSERDPYYAPYFDDAGGEDLQMPSADVNIPKNLWSLAKREEYKVIEVLRDPITGIVGFDVEHLLQK